MQRSEQLQTLLTDVVSGLEQAKQQTGVYPQFARQALDFVDKAAELEADGKLESLRYSAYAPSLECYRYGMNTVVGTVAEIVAACHILSTREYPSEVTFVDGKEDQDVGYDLLHINPLWKHPASVSVKYHAGTSADQCPIMLKWLYKLGTDEVLPRYPVRMMVMGPTHVWSFDMNTLYHVEAHRSRYGLSRSGSGDDRTTWISLDAKSLVNNDRMRLERIRVEGHTGISYHKQE